MSSVDPNVVRALVRQALEQKFGLGPTDSLSLRERAGVKGRPAAIDEIGRRVRVVQPATHLSVHPSQLAIGEGSADSDCYEDMDLPLQKPCLIEPHRPCYNSGYCRKLGH